MFDIVFECTCFFPFGLSCLEVVCLEDNKGFLKQRKFFGVSRYEEVFWNSIFQHGTFERVMSKLTAELFV